MIANIVTYFLSSCSAHVTLVTRVLRSCHESWLVLALCQNSCHEESFTGLIDHMLPYIWPQHAKRIVQLENQGLTSCKCFTPPRI